MAETGQPCDGPRFRNLEKAFHKALEKVVAGCSSENIRLFSPELSSIINVPTDQIDDVYKDFFGNVAANTTREFAAIIEENNVRAMLNSLDNIVREHKPSGATPRRVQKASDVVEATRARTLLVKELERARLTALLAEIEQSNRVLTASVAEVEERARLAHAESVSSTDLKQAAAAADSAVPMTTLQQIELWGSSATSHD